MVIYYLIFLFLVERKKQHVHMYYKLNKVNSYISMVIYSQLFLFLLKIKITSCQLKNKKS